MQFDWAYTFSLFLDPELWQGAGIVVALSVLAWTIANVAGIILALMRESRTRVLNIVAGLYIWLFRSLPLLVLLVFAYNIPQVFPPSQVILGSSFNAALVAMILHEAAYMAEIHRGGLLSVGLDQREAAKALGLRYGQFQRRIVLPQAFRISLPSLGNEFVSILKLTSLASVISLPEILLVGQRLYTQNFLVLETLTAVAAFYVLLVTIFDQLRGLLERHLDVTRRHTALENVSSDLPGRVERIREAHPHSGEKIVEARGVTKTFGENQVLKGVDLDVHRGEVVVVIGPSGSGKTTLVRTLNHLEPHDGGIVLVNGETVGYRPGNDGRLIPRSDASMAEQRSNIGMVFQRFNLFPHLSVLENIALAPQQTGLMGREEAQEYARTLLGRVGLAQHASKYPHQLSGGQQQRVAIARALAMKPSVMLFDEPTSALDPELVAEVLEVIADLANDGMTMVIVTHEMKLARDVADWVVFMEDGNVVEAGPPALIFGSEGHERIQRFVRHVSNTV
ncbi:amino acid ABC transporter permease/ATP-binding protein [Paeniglutamicibacter cryotolerans]|uniref:Polar amino acid transport system permease protein n=1 Tax=Paeniglutamicibacter cryotolerans TaxID=670079 RepID=A0A839QP23_9MICC|nr:amino acid ABC transporter permease/ATP-binding protein [Paeniglutamicibacter cryotolerans]MBB2995746.1 polar amino acid transport system permease protein [Paeniglutamicibacter cryotolerans]